MRRDMIIFDLDGVIVDSEKLHYEAYCKAFEIFDFDLSLEMYKKYLWSRGRKAGLKAILETDEETREAIGNEKDQQYVKLIEEGKISVFDDAMILINELSRRKIRMAVATASKLGKAVIDKMNLSSYFEVIITSLDVKNNKPHPEIYLKAMDKLGVQAESCFVIEDSNAGAIAGLEAGAEVFFIKREGAPSLSNEIAENPSIRVIENLEEVIAVLP